MIAYGCFTAGGFDISLFLIRVKNLVGEVGQVIVGDEFAGCQTADDVDAASVSCARRLYDDRPVKALVKAFLELNAIRARDGVPYSRRGDRYGVCEEYFSSVVDDVNTAVKELTGITAHCHPSLYK